MLFLFVFQPTTPEVLPTMGVPARDDVSEYFLVMISSIFGLASTALLP